MPKGDAELAGIRFGYFRRNESRTARIVLEKCTKAAPHFLNDIEQVRILSLRQDRSTHAPVRAQLPLTRAASWMSRAKRIHRSCCTCKRPLARVG